METLDSPDPFESRSDHDEKLWTMRPSTFTRKEGPYTTFNAILFQSPGRFPSDSQTRVPYYLEVCCEVFDHNADNSGMWTIIQLLQKNHSHQHVRRNRNGFSFQTSWTIWKWLENMKGVHLNEGCWNSITWDWWDRQDAHWNKHAGCLWPASKRRPWRVSRKRLQDVSARLLRLFTVCGLLWTMFMIWTLWYFNVFAMMNSARWDGPSAFGMLLSGWRCRDPSLPNDWRSPASSNWLGCQLPVGCLGHVLNVLCFYESGLWSFLFSWCLASSCPCVVVCFLCSSFLLHM